MEIVTCHSFSQLKRTFLYTITLSIYLSYLFITNVWIRRWRQLRKMASFHRLSKVSLKSFFYILLHVRNIFHSVPLGYTIHMKNSNKNMSRLVKKSNYRKYNWCISADSKVVTIVSSLQLGYRKHGCLIYEWNSRAPNNH